ncbi:hypothetical protein PVAP13_1NG418776 [Panicum virgatum]|uniref:ATP-dependent DNA helicase n=1 Tax=Panicum virgatum TaxID=38727 RepID=A0A8T0WZB7_PANVG|nr:hypothetical protein PVAP13_1NG418776 [Panicum virgatum]
MAIEIVNRPELVSRVYKAKLREVKELLIKKQYFGEVAAYVHHGSKLTTPEGYDKFISAEIPDNDKNCPSTQQGTDSYPLYRRRDDGRRVKIRACSNIKAVKYLYKDARYISPPEAVHRIFGFPLFGVYPASVPFEESDNLEDVVRHPGSDMTTLTEKLLYREFPEHYRWIKGRKIGRVIYANPAEGERYFLMVLLNHVRVAGITYSTFREACEKRGLIETDRLFATILKHKNAMAAVEQQVLRDIRDMVHSMGKDFRTYGLPDVNDAREEQNVRVDQDDIDAYKSLNKEQRTGFDEIIRHVIDRKSQVFFIDGPGGTGKTFLYKAVLAKVRSEGMIAIATATSGIAASLLPGGGTAHSRFKIPIKVGHNSMCNFTKQSDTAELLRQASLIIWDEVAMTKRQAVETLDKSLQDIMESSLPFGGKVMLFGGDFRQILPVVTRGTRAQITEVTLQRSYLWENIRKIRLSRNMRAQSDRWFSEYLLRIGNGTKETIGDDYVRLPNDIFIGYTDTEVVVQTLIEHVFPSLEENATSASYMSTRAILSTKNEHVDKLNTMMIDNFPGESTVFYSFDFRR